MVDLALNFSQGIKYNLFPDDAYWAKIWNTSKYIKAVFVAVRERWRKSILEFVQVE